MNDGTSQLAALASELIWATGRWSEAEPGDRGAEIGFLEDRSEIEAALRAAFGSDQTPQWWVGIGEIKEDGRARSTDSVMAEIGSAVVIARSPERGVLEIRYVAEPRGGQYVERWSNWGEVEARFEHASLPGPIVIQGHGPSGHAELRAKLAEWARHPVPD